MDGTRSGAWAASPVSGHFPTSSDTQASLRNLQTDVVTNPATAMPSDWPLAKHVRFRPKAKMQLQIP